MLAGAGYVILALVGNGLAGEVTLDTDPAAFRIGSGLEFFGFCLLTVFVAQIYVIARARDASWLPVAALLSGIATLAIKLSTAASWLVMASMRAGELSPEVDQTLEDIGSVGFQLTFLTFGLFVLATASSLYRTGLIHRALFWPGIVLGTASIAAVNLPFSEDSPAAIPLLLSLFWTLALSLLLFRVASRWQEPA